MKLLAIIAVICVQLSALAQAPPILRTIFTTNPAPVALNIVTGIVSSLTSGITNGYTDPVSLKTNLFVAGTNGANHLRVTNSTIIGSNLTFTTVNDVGQATLLQIQVYPGTATPGMSIGGDLDIAPDENSFWIGHGLDVAGTDSFVLAGASQFTNTFAAIGYGLKGVGAAFVAGKQARAFGTDSFAIGLNLQSGADRAGTIGSLITNNAADSLDIGFSQNSRVSFGLLNTTFNGAIVGNTTINVATNIALVNAVSNLYVLGTRYTNVVRRSFVSASVQLNAAAAGTAVVTLYVERTGITNQIQISAGPLASLTTTEPLMALVGPGEIYYFADETSGAGASVAIIAKTCSRVDL